LSVSVEAVWHQRSDRDPGIQWIVKELTEALKSAD
jgi:hypothetical protein